MDAVLLYIQAVLTRRSLFLSSLILGLQSPACASSGPAQPGSGCRVGHVVDGDTFYCRDGRKIRLIGIDAPERTQSFGSVAAQALVEMLPAGTPVRLQLDVSPRDQYGRVLAYVWIGSSLVNERLVRDGWAVLYTVPPNVKYAGRLRRAQNEARTSGAGLWAQRGFDCLPSDFRNGRCVSSP